MKNQQEFLAMIEDYLERDVFPGVNFAILEGEEVSEYLFGKAALIPEPIALTPGKKWDLASLTKVIGTGTAVIDLVLAGKLELDAPLQKYYAKFTDSTVSLRQLLTHTSGIDPYIPNRDKLGFFELTEAINQIRVTDDKSFKYTDINFILLGFLLEEYYDESLDYIFNKNIFKNWEMKQTSFGSVENAVPTSQNIPLGTVHDPKAQVLKNHCGSAGLFSTLSDMILFSQAYFREEKYLDLLKNYADGAKERSLAWDLPAENNDWLLHTGYTGTFILINPRIKKAVVFLSNRVHLKDNREKWIEERDRLIKFLINHLSLD
ncbi:serine hydrolase domain-containing protein [Lactococcus cremoris]|uniref:serine hydrolase domain-containing protein n=1 Tax=Lactococcus lactis subsp. cremoris TaxID=1359 RepID=UPI002FC86135